MPYDYQGTYEAVYGKMKKYGAGSPERMHAPEIVAWAARHRLSKVHVLMCGRGYGVLALRKAGVEAFGVEIAAKPLWRIRKYVARGDVVEYARNLEPSTGAGVVSIDGLEHLEQHDLMTLLESTAGLGGPIYAQVSCRPDHFGPRLLGKPLHLTVKPKDWWNAQFSRRWNLLTHNYREENDAYLWIGAAKDETQGRADCGT